MGWASGGDSRVANRERVGDLKVGKSGVSEKTQRKQMEFFAGEREFK